MNAMVAASDEQIVVLDSLVTMARDIERSIDGMHAARDGVLALANRLALSMAEDAGGAHAADLTTRSVAAELAAALRVSDRTVQRRMADAELKIERFPGVWAAQGAGRISAGHARVIVDAGLHIDDPDSRAAYAARAVEYAEDESPNRLRPVAERLAQHHQPQSIDERHARERDTRSVWVKDHPDAMAELGLLGPAALVHGAYERLTEMAKTVAAASRQTDADRQTADGQALDQHAGAGAAGDTAASSAVDPRTLSQTRADLALDLLLTGTPAGHDTADGLLSAIAAHIGVTVPVTTLMGEPGPPQNSTDGARSIRSQLAGWPAPPRDGTGCSPTLSPVRCSPWTATGPPNH